jgi:hypothetical protein
LDTAQPWAQGALRPTGTGWDAAHAARSRWPLLEEPPANASIPSPLPVTPDGRIPDPAQQPHAVSDGQRVGRLPSAQRRDLAEAEFGNQDLANRMAANGVSASLIEGMCGPIAAAAALKAYGLTADPAALAKWGQDNGEWAGYMTHGSGVGLQKMLASQGLESSVEAADPAIAVQAIQAGGVAVLNFPNHYMTASDYDPATGKFYVGNTGSNALRGGSDWMSFAEMQAAPGNGGGLRSVIVPTGAAAQQGAAPSNPAPAQPATPPSGAAPLAQGGVDRGGALDPSAAAGGVWGLVDRKSAEWGLDDPNVLRALVLAESGGNPAEIGDSGQSYGLLQAYTGAGGGRGSGHDPARLLDPEYNLDIAQPEITQAYAQARGEGLEGAALARRVGQLAQRPDPAYYHRYSDAYDTLAAGGPPVGSGADTSNVPPPPRPLPAGLGGQPSSPSDAPTGPPWTAPASTAPYPWQVSPSATPATPSWAMPDPLAALGGAARSVAGLPATVSERLLAGLPALPDPLAAVRGVAPMEPWQPTTGTGGQSPFMARMNAGLPALPSLPDFGRAATDIYARGPASPFTADNAINRQVAANRAASYAEAGITPPTATAMPLERASALGGLALHPPTGVGVAADIDRALQAGGAPPMTAQQKQALTFALQTVPIGEADIRPAATTASGILRPAGALGGPESVAGGAPFAGAAPARTGASGVRAGATEASAIGSVQVDEPGAARLIGVVPPSPVARLATTSAAAGVPAAQLDATDRALARARLDPQGAAAHLQAVRDAYAAVSTPRADDLTVRARAAWIALHGPQHARLFDEAVRAGDELNGTNRVLASFAGPEALVALADEGVFTTGPHTAKDLATFAAEQAGRVDPTRFIKRGAALGLDRAQAVAQGGRDFVRRLTQADRMAFGATPNILDDAGRVDPLSPVRVYGYNTLGPPELGDMHAAPNVGLVFKDAAHDPTGAFYLTEPKHHFGKTSPHYHVHEGERAGIAAAVWSPQAVHGARIEPDPWGNFVAGYRGIPLPNGRTLAQTDLTVGPSGAARVQTLGMLLAMGRGGEVAAAMQNGVIKTGRQLWAALARGGVSQHNPLYRQFADARVGAGLEPLKSLSEAQKRVLRLGYMTNADRQEAMILDPQIAQLKALVVRGHPAALGAVVPNSGGRTLLGLLQQVQALAGGAERLPIILYDQRVGLTKAGEPVFRGKLINTRARFVNPDGTLGAPIGDFLAPDRRLVRDTYARLAAPTAYRVGDRAVAAGDRPFPDIGQVGVQAALVGGAAAGLGGAAYGLGQTAQGQQALGSALRTAGGAIGTASDTLRDLYARGPASPFAPAAREAPNVRIGAQLAQAAAESAKSGTSEQQPFAPARLLQGLESSLTGRPYSRERALLLEAALQTVPQGAVGPYGGAGRPPRPPAPLPPLPEVPTALERAAQQFSAYTAADLLSGIPGMGRNILGGGPVFASEVGTKGLAPLNEAGLRALKAGLVKIVGGTVPERTRFFSELPAALHGAQEGVKPGVQGAWEALRGRQSAAAGAQSATGVSREIVGGSLNPLNYVLRAYGANDAAAGAVGSRLGDRAAAERIASQRGLAGPARQQIVDLLTDLGRRARLPETDPSGPTSIPPTLKAAAAQVRAEGDAVAGRLTVRDGFGVVGKQLASMQRWPFIGPILMPFSNGVNAALKSGYQHSPAALGELLLRKPLGLTPKSVPAGYGDMADRLARVEMGLGGVAGAYQLYQAGVLTGARPTDQRLAREWDARGNVEYSINLGPAGHLPFTMLTPLAPTLMATVQALDAAKAGQDTTTIAKAAAGGWLNGMGQLPFIQGWGDVTNVIGTLDAAQQGDTGPLEQALAQVLKSRVGAVVPASGFLRTVEQNTDPYRRQPATPGQTVQGIFPVIGGGLNDPPADAPMPGGPLVRGAGNALRGALRQTPAADALVPNILPRQLLGKPVPSGADFPAGIVSPFKRAGAADDPGNVLGESLRTGVAVPEAPKTVQAEGGPTDLTPEQAYHYNEVLGRFVDQYRAALIATDKYRTAPLETQQALTKATDALARADARDVALAELDIAPARAAGEPERYDLGRLQGALQGGRFDAATVAAYTAHPALFEADVRKAARKYALFRASRGATVRPTETEGLLAKLAAARYHAVAWQVWARDPVRRQQAALEDGFLAGLGVDSVADQTAPVAPPPAGAPAA